MRNCKKKKVLVKAYRLGDNSSMQKHLEKLGKIIPENDGYRLFSMETEGTHLNAGQKADIGYYFKVDETEKGLFPYPIKPDYFAAHYRHVEEDIYEVVSVPVPFWTVQDGICEEIEWLWAHGKLDICPENKQKYFSAELWGTRLYADENAKILFYNVERNEKGDISNIDFNFVDAAVFNETYDVI